MGLVVRCYQLTSQFPKTEIYGLSNQIQRATVSIPANIADGNVEIIWVVISVQNSIANGSLKELETHLMIVGRYAYVKLEVLKVVFNKCEEIGRMLHSLMEKLTGLLKKNRLKIMSLPYTTIFLPYTTIFLP